MIGASLLLAAFLLSFLGSRTIVAQLSAPAAVDVWFEADVPRVVENMTERWSDHGRVEAHPLFSLLTYPPNYALQLLGVPKLLAVRLEVAFIGALAILGLYIAMRLLGAGRPRAAMLGALGLTSATYIFWLPVPETHSLASVTVLMAVLLAACKTRGRVVSEEADLLVSAGTLSLTSTNWMYGILATLPGRSPRRFVVLVLAALGLVAGAWTIQHEIFPSTRFFLATEMAQVGILAPESGGPIGVARSFFVHSVVMPAIAVVDRPSSGAWPILITQPSAVGSAGWAGLLGAVLWLALLALGALTLLRQRGVAPMRWLLVGGLIGQLALYTYFGNETFLYAPNFVPLLIMLAGFALLGAQARFAVPVVALLIPVLALNNGRQLGRALDVFDTYAAYHHDEAGARERRPEDPWPREAPRTEMSLAREGAFDRGYHLTGGSFSPARSTFGVSFWVLGPDGAPVAWSSGMPAEAVVERAAESEAGTVHRIATETPSYRATWTATGFRRWRLDLIDVPDGRPLMVLVRSVGPSGGPLRSIRPRADGLLLNERWDMSFEPAPLSIGTGTEGGADWWLQASAGPAEDPSGWGFARVNLEDGSVQSIRLVDQRGEEGIDRLLDTLR